MNEHAFPPPPVGHVTLAVSMIVGGSFYHAGTTMPLDQLAKIPPNLRREEYLIRHSKGKSEPAGPASLTYTLNTSYTIDSDGNRRNRNVEREIIRLEQADLEQRAIEDALSAEPGEQTKVALAEIQASHDANVAEQIAEGQFQARQNDLADQAAKELTEEQMVSNDHVVSPAIMGEQPEPAPKRKLKTRYVKRFGNKMVRARKLRNLKINEPVFVRENGHYVQAGKVNAHRHLPLIYKED